MSELTDIREIKALLDRHGFRFSKSLGQNFLIQPWVPEKIAECSMLDGNTGVLEIGPGIGCLTSKLSEQAGKVVSIELDPSLMPILEETLSGCGNVEIVFGDVLKQDLNKIVAEKMQGFRPVVCANLPYNITSPVISALLKAGCFRQMTLMVQKEVAARICAKAGDDDYSAFSILVQWYADPELMFDVAPDCFLPQPKVTSSVIRLKVPNVRRYHTEDEEFMFRVVRSAFGQRRKTLVNALSSGIRELSKQDIADTVSACGFDERIRGEELSINEYCLLSDELLRRIHLFKH
ncbi:MAG: 16S rRNA (adenine(1518)-N(6)/adenine(1519)-N(6))-dimethyltransferase RsmA [Oscillospiraceae bacterium]|nr:16S rRNA (adenine(1518)-N(6)/adenine(1519)-N(6))-dimethyltransferase RsmA [Oscillospiraceae bacterium]